MIATPDWTRARRIGLAAMLGTLAVAVPAQGQTRPFRGLFGASPGEDAPALNIVGSVQGGYDDNALAQEPSGSDPRTQVGSSFYGARAAISFADEWGRVSFGASGDASFQHYPAIDDFTSRALGAGVGLGIDFSSRTRLRASQAVSFRPSYQFAPFAEPPPSILGETPTSNLDHALASGDSAYASSSLVIERNLSPRSVLAASADYSYSTFSQSVENEFGLPAVSESRIGMRFTRSVTPSLGVRAGYAYRRATYGTGSDSEVEGHEIDVGAEYARSVAIGPRANLAFSTGSALLRTENGNDFRFLGNASLNVEISQSWLARAVYDRNMSYMAGFVEPLFQDAISGNLAGAVGERTRLGFSGGYSRGDVGLGETGSAFTASSGQATVQFLVTSIVAAECQYFLYRYDFEQASVLPFGLPPEFTRQGVRAALTVAIPVRR